MSDCSSTRLLLTIANMVKNAFYFLSAKEATAHVDLQEPAATEEIEIINESTTS